MDSPSAARCAATLNTNVLFCDGFKIHAVENKRGVTGVKVMRIAQKHEHAGLKMEGKGAVLRRTKT